MAELETQHSMRSLLCTDERDFLIRNNGEQVKIENLEGKIVGLFFSESSLRVFLPPLPEVYTKLVENGDFEIIFVSDDEDEKSFEEYHKTMPWLALPLSDTQTKEKLEEVLDVKFIPTLILLDQKCKTISTHGLYIIEDYGADAYPFSKERLAELKAQKAATQSLNSLLVSPDRDFVHGSGGRNVPVSELVGKTVCLYFAVEGWPICRGFTRKLIKFYNDLKGRGENLEVVFISGDRNTESFEDYFERMPWLALPYGDPLSRNLCRCFEIDAKFIPTLIVLGPDGKTLQTEAVELIMEHGVEVYPFTKEKLDELKAQEEARRAAQTLEPLLVSDERNFVIKNNFEKVPVSELTGKTVGLYFCDDWSPACREFTPKLVQVYEKLKQNGEAFEIVILSSDQDEEDFEEYHASVPWLALPYGDIVRRHLSHYFCIQGIPSLVIVGPDGKTVTTDARNIVSVHGAKAYPFTDARLIELQKEIDEVAEKYPKEIKHDLHEHSLNLTQRKAYNCDGSQEEGSTWSFYCKEWDFGLHPDCALNDKHSDGNEKQQTQAKDFQNKDKPLASRSLRYQKSNGRRPFSPLKRTNVFNGRFLTSFPFCNEGKNKTMFLIMVF